jgi:hypothetical protein
LTRLVRDVSEDITLVADANGELLYGKEEGTTARGTEEGDATSHEGEG